MSTAQAVPGEGPELEPQPGEGPPEEGGGPKPSEVVDAGGTNMSPESVLMMGAELAWKEQNGQPLDEMEQAFVEEFFPGGLPPEIAQFAPQTKQQFEDVQGQVEGQPPQPGLPPAQGPPGQPAPQPQAQPAPQPQPQPPQGVPQ